MKILAVHDRYQFRGGEDDYHDAKVRLLAAHGHEIRELIFDNGEISGRNRLSVALETSWNRAVYRGVLNITSSGWLPDVIDIDNFFPLGSPSIHYAASELRIPVVQTLHNYRLLCPGATMFRGGRICEDCIKRTVPWPGVVHGCYRGSRRATAAAAAMISLHNFLRTWQKKVTLFIALTEFARQKFIEGGLPPERIVVKPNFVEDDAGPGTGGGDFVLYVGRMSWEKGIYLLLEAWKEAQKHAVRLILAGDGPLAPVVERAARSMNSLQYVGRKPLADIYDLMGMARATLFPSVWYEGLPGVVIQSFSRGTPVVANRLGSMEQLIRDGETGWLVERQTPGAFAAAISKAFSQGTQNAGMRLSARQEFERRYTAETNYHLMIDIYNRAISERQRTSPSKKDSEHSHIRKSKEIQRAA